MAYVSSMTYATEAQFMEAVQAARLTQQASLSAASFQQALAASTTAYQGTSLQGTNQISSGITSPADLDAYFQEAADTYNISVDLLKAVAKQESNFQTNIVSSSGAVGVMQLMPSTAAYLGVADSYDPYQNIMGGAKLLSQLSEHYQGDLSLTLAAYNAGSGAVDTYGGIPPYAETQNFVAKIKASLGIG